MRSVALIPASALVCGALTGSALSCPAPVPWALAALAALGWAGWMARRSAVVVACATAGYALAGVGLAARAEEVARHTPLRATLERAFGGFEIDRVSAPGAHPPLVARIRLDEDAAVSAGGVRLRGTIEALAINGRVAAAPGGVLLTVSGAVAPERVSAWRAGRVVEVPVVFRRPARYLTTGVADGEAASARNGVSLTGRVKSGLVVEVVAAGTRWSEWTAAVRSGIRRRVAASMPGGAGMGAGIVTALLIGDRTAIPSEVRDQLQAAGTYHVIAISGGNIAVIALLVAGMLRLSGLGPRALAGFTIPVLVGYASLVSGGPSVWRAVVMAVLYLSARVLDLQTPTWNALAVSAGLLVCVSPLDVRDAGFWLTYGATAALLGVGQAWQGAGADEPLLRRAAWWLVTTITASVAVELVMLPVTAGVFGRVPLYGVAANLVAVPAMTTAQLAGVCMLADVPWLAGLCGVVADNATRALVATSALAQRVPYLSPRVPPPPLWGWLVFAGLLALAWRSSRRGAALLALFLGVAVWANVPARPGSGADGRLSLTLLDVGQGEAMVLRLPDGRVLMVDAGGGGGSEARLGDRVVGPALWARGIRRLDGVVVTHADPDHVAGVPEILRDFRPPILWTGIDVHGHAASELMEQAAAAVRTRRAHWNAGTRAQVGGVTVRVLHPAVPEWERRVVRNDDSVVLEIRYGDVALLLTGDAGAGVEESLLGQLSLAPIRILKVGHHGSRGSTSPALLRSWAPQLALISCGRGNSFGHPSPVVLSRLAEAGAHILRTDVDGEVTIETDGHAVRFRTFMHPAWVPVPLSHETYPRLSPS